MVQEVIMSDAGSGSRFPFLKRNRNDDTPSDFSQRMDLNSPVTGEINQIFTPSQPRHAAAPSDATSDFPASPHPPKAWTKTPNANMPWR